MPAPRELTRQYALKTSSIFIAVSVQYLIKQLSEDAFTLGNENADKLPINLFYMAFTLSEQD